MWIERIALRRFLVFEDGDVSLGNGFNVVVSPNEGGKSSLLEGIVTALYRDASSRRREIIALRRWGSSILFRIEAVLYLGGERMRIVRDFEERRQALFRGNEDRAFLEGKAVDEYLRTHLPLPDEHLFSRVCGVHQDGVAVSDGKRALGERLEEILGGGWGEATPAAVESMIEEHRGRLRRGMDHPAHRENWGPIRRCTEEISLLETQLGASMLIRQRREELLRSIALCERDIGQYCGELELARRSRERADRYAELVRREEDARKAADSLLRSKERLEELIEKRDALVGLGKQYPDELVQCARSYLQACRLELERERMLRDELRHAERASGEARPPLWTAAGAALMVLVGVAGTIFFNRWLALLAVTGVFLLIWLLYEYRRDRIDPVVRQKAADLEHLAEKRAAWTGRLSMDESVELLGRVEGWKEQLSDCAIRIEEAAGEGVDPEEAVRAIDLRCGDAALEWRAVREERESLEPFRLGAEERLALERTIESLTATVDTLRLQLEPMTNELARLEHADTNAIVERIASLRAELERATRSGRVLDAMLDALRDARSRMAGFLAGELPRSAGEIVSRLTAGRYRTVVVDPVTLGVETVPAREDISREGFAGSVPEAIAPDLLSRGAADQLYLAVRLALVELLGTDEPQPVFLDDTLVHFDPERRVLALEALRDISRRHQIILFTCDDSYGRFADRIVRLDA